MTFVTEHLVRFAHVDAAGIVFYPRYFEMVNAAVEDLFASAVGVNMNVLHIDRKLGIPTVKLDAEFVAPSRLWDLLTFTVSVLKVGRSSLELAMEITCGAEVRFRTYAILVCMDLASGRSLPWPDDLRAGLAAQL